MYPERAIDPLQFPPKQKVWVVLKSHEFGVWDIVRIFSIKESAEAYIRSNKEPVNICMEEYEVS